MTNPEVVSAPAVSAALVVAFAIQQIIEILDSISSVVFDTDKQPELVGKKKLLLKLCSLGLGIFAAAAMNIDVLAGVTAIASQWHLPISAVALAGGTEGVNSVLKYLGYAKENKKNDAASKLDPAKSEQLKTIGRK